MAILLLVAVVKVDTQCEHALRVISPFTQAKDTPRVKNGRDVNFFLIRNGCFRGVNKSGLLYVGHPCHLFIYVPCQKFGFQHAFRERQNGGKRRRRKEQTGE